MGMFEAIGRSNFQTSIEGTLDSIAQMRRQKLQDAQAGEELEMKRQEFTQTKEMNENKLAVLSQERKQLTREIPVDVYFQGKPGGKDGAIGKFVQQEWARMGVLNPNGTISGWGQKQWEERKRSDPELQMQMSQVALQDVKSRYEKLSTGDPKTLGMKPEEYKQALEKASAEYTEMHNNAMQVENAVKTKLLSGASAELKDYVLGEIGLKNWNPEDTASQEFQQGFMNFLRTRAAMKRGPDKFDAPRAVVAWQTPDGQIINLRTNEMPPQGSQRVGTVPQKEGAGGGKPGSIEEIQSLLSQKVLGANANAGQPTPAPAATNPLLDEFFTTIAAPK